jgi:hypothetical protein
VAKKICPKTAPKALQMIRSGELGIRIELASFIDALEPFVKATYTLEGDGSNLPFDTYNIIHNLSHQSAIFQELTHPILSGASVVRYKLRLWSKLVAKA